MLHPTRMKHRWLFAPLFLALLAGFGLLTMFLWNTTMPHIFSLPALNYWQATCLLLLSKLLFGSHFRSHGPASQHSDLLKRKINSLTPEQREKLVEKYKHNRSAWCYHGSHDSCAENPTEENKQKIGSSKNKDDKEQY
jgi:hypothetical protein